MGRPVGFNTKWATKKPVVGYRAVHARLMYEIGKAKEFTCECGKQAQEWAYLGDENEMVATASYELGKVYSQNLDAYTPMCCSCHRKMDGE